jgi:hypothetical protein
MSTLPLLEHGGLEGEGAGGNMGGGDVVCVGRHQPGLPHQLRLCEFVEKKAVKVKVLIVIVVVM